MSHWGAIQWGNAPNAVEALATVIAAVGAIKAAQFTGRTLRIEQNRDAERHAEQLRAQAELVSVWLHDRPYTTPCRWFTLRNASRQPVHNVAVTVYRDPVDGPSHVRDFEVLPPNEDRQDSLPDEPIWQVGKIGVDQRISMEFTDERGVRWLRDRDGILRRI